MTKLFGFPCPAPVAEGNARYAHAHRRWRQAVAGLLCCVAMLVSGQLHAASSYLLGPQDVLKIRVFEWRPSAGVAFEWVPLTGEFTVSAAGTLSLPIVGTIAVAGKTPEQIADIIGEQLQNQIGLQKRPTASIEVSSYRPFFVTGAVATPGKYNYLPGLTVMQALSMAGGTGTMDPKIMELQREALVNHGTARELEVERLSILAKRARVTAALSGSDKVTMPPELSTTEDQETVSQIVIAEQELLDSRARSIKSEIAAVQQSKALAKNQIETLKLKEASLDKQIDLANKDLNSVNKLVSQGLTVSARQLGANQNVADLESRNLDVSLAILTIQQDLAKLDQDALTIVEKYKAAALAEATEIRDRLAANEEKTRTAHALLLNIEMRAPVAVSMPSADGRVRTTTTITRATGSANKTYVVADDDPVLPGDVIKVEPQDQKSGTRAMTSTQ
ncbi:polysaccharide biosynthesis/export family protein [Neorhizobium sp. JUb45]|uniref:polysaccharide biosynthesis/export family protein n=1 Tax=unclassified Neorhizobium TaxID=2629175 RepID=UPI0010489490|nr:polysaccharide biosynthesis/export family protein [Neorhizobium sp. JUb45]TCQ99966.1 polysaccharide export outer membrane protein [Neorhizobium sp. JUb45]